MTPGSCAASRGAGCLPAGRRCCSPHRSPRPPRDPSVCACTRVPAASRRGRLCHMEPGTPGTTGVCVKAGAGTCAPWPWGQPPASPAPGTHWAAAWKATGWARVLCMSETELLGCGRSPQPDTASPVTHHPRVPDSQVMEDGVAPPSIPACAASGPAAGTREGDKGRVRGARHPQAPGCLAVPAAVPALGAKAGRAGGRRVACQSGGAGGRGHSCHLALWEGGLGGVAPGRAGTPGSLPASRGSRAGSPSAGERLEQEVYGAALSDANGLKPIKRDGFM